jgi:hypothetical protein
MFLDDSFCNVDLDIFRENYNIIVEEYKKFRDAKYLINYSHLYDLTSSLNPRFSGHIPRLTEDHPWKICPLIYNRSSIPLLPIEIQNSKTVEILLSQKIKPVVAVFSILEPGVVLDKHHDTDERIDPRYLDSSVIKIHFSLDIPLSGESGLVVEDEERILSNGDLNLFDEHYTHYAYNKSLHRRGVLIASYIRKEIIDI